MEDKEQIIDQSQLAESLSEKIPYNMTKDFLVKPLDPIMVKKEFDQPVAKDKATTDENGVEAVDYDEVKTEVKEVESDYRKGVILKVPYEYTSQLNDEKYAPMNIKVGDVIIYPVRSAKWFDLLKDTQLVRAYDILGTETTKA